MAAGVEQREHGENAKAVYLQTRFLMKYACSFYRHPCAAFARGRLALAYAGVYHACAVLISSTGLVGLVLAVLQLGLQDSKPFIVVVRRRGSTGVCELCEGPCGAFESFGALRAPNGASAVSGASGASLHSAVPGGIGSQPN